MTAATLPGTEPSAGDDVDAPGEAPGHPSSARTSTANAQRRQISPGVTLGVAGTVVAALLAVVGGLISAGFSDLREDIRALGDRIDSQGGRIDSLGDRIDSQGGRIDSLGDRIDSQDRRIDSLGGRIDSLGGRIDSLGDRIDSLATELRTEMREGFAQVNRTLAEHGRLHRDHSERLARLETLVAPPGAASTNSDAPHTDVD